MRRPTGWFVLLSLLAGVGLVVSPSRAAVCPGDCDGDRRVGIGEIVRGARVLLEIDPPDACDAVDVNGDLDVTVDELIDTVRASLEGCPAPPGARCFIDIRGGNVANVDCRGYGTECGELVFNDSRLGLDGTCCTRRGYPCDTDDDCCRYFGSIFDDRAELCVDGRCCVQRWADCSGEDPARRAPCCDPKYECVPNGLGELRCHRRQDTLPQ